MNGFPLQIKGMTGKNEKQDAVTGNKNMTQCQASIFNSLTYMLLNNRSRDGFIRKFDGVVSLHCPRGSVGAVSEATHSAPLAIWRVNESG